MILEAERNASSRKLLPGCQAVFSWSGPHFMDWLAPFPLPTCLAERGGPFHEMGALQGRAKAFAQETSSSWTTAAAKPAHPSAVTPPRSVIARSKFSEAAREHQSPFS